MSCFLIPTPLPCSFPLARSVIKARGARNVKRRRKAPTAASLLLPPAPIPPPISALVAELSDPTAQSMLRSLSITPLPTSLCPDTISTSHLTHSHTSRNPALVFLHGFDSNILEFRRLHSVLSTNAPTTLHYVDILGWGLTSRPAGISYGPAAKREHLRSFLDKVEPDRPVILVGASLGGAVAVDFALEYPDRVSRIVLIDGQVYLDRPKVPLPRFAASVGADVLRSSWLRNMAIDMSYEKEEFKCEEVVKISGFHCFMDGWKDATIDFIMGEGYCVSERVGQVKDKSLVIWGEYDRVLPRVAGLERFRNDGFPVVVAPGCGHCPHVEDPVFVANLIRKLVNTTAY